MIRTVTLATALATAFALSAMAADTTTKDTATAPGSTPTIAAPAAPAGATTATAPAATTAVPKTVVTTSVQPDGGILLTEDEGKTWKDKPVYSSDGSKIGEVVDFQRGTDARVVGMHADIGGFLGFMQTRVNLTTTQFKLQGDRVVLSLTAAEAKTLPAI